MKVWCNMKKKFFVLLMVSLLLTSCSKNNTSSNSDINTTASITTTTVSSSEDDSDVTTVSLETMPIKSVKLNDEEFKETEMSNGKYRSDFKADIDSVIASGKYTYLMDTIDKETENRLVMEIVRDGDKICVRMFNRTDDFVAEYERGRLIDNGTDSYIVDFTKKTYKETPDKEYYEYDKYSDVLGYLFSDTLIPTKTLTNGDYICEVFSDGSQGIESKYYYDKNGKFIKMSLLLNNEQYLSVRFSYSGEVDSTFFELPEDLNKK